MTDPSEADAVRDRGPVDASHSEPRRLKRAGPRPEELALLRLCRFGPRRLVDGPVGRCTKRGWLKAVVEVADGGVGTVVRYDLTDMGRIEVETSTVA